MNAAEYFVQIIMPIKKVAYEEFRERIMAENADRLRELGILDDELIMCVTQHSGRCTDFLIRKFIDIHLYNRE